MRRLAPFGPEEDTMPRYVAIAPALLCAVLCVAPALAQGSAQETACGEHRLQTCPVQKHRVAVESGYYQNASRVGGTALAEYPQTRLLYGATSNLQLSYDAPSEIARSGNDGTGVYSMTHMGYGAEYGLGASQDLWYGITGELHPQPGALYNMQLLPLSTLEAAVNWTPTAAMEYGTAFGTLTYRRVSRSGNRSSPTAALFAARSLDERTLVTTGINVLSRPFFGASAQTAGTVGLQRELFARTYLNMSVGSTFNPAAHTKPHYLSFNLLTR